MTLFKGLILLAAMAVATSGQVLPWSRALDDLCLGLGKEMWKYSDLKTDGKKAFDFAATYIARNAGVDVSGSKLTRAWEAVMTGECTSSSWDYIVRMNKCYTEHMSALYEPLATYPDKCLTSEHVSQTIKHLTGGMFASRVDLVDAKFIDKCYEHGRADNLDSGVRKSKNLEQIMTDGSPGAVIDAIERDFVKRGKNPKREFHADPSSARHYLEKKLFKPCEKYLNQYRKILSDMKSISWKLTGGQAALMDLMDPEAKMIALRLMYCYVVRSSRALREDIIQALTTRFL